jgi:hypothetical protein
MKMKLGRKKVKITLTKEEAHQIVEGMAALYKFRGTGSGNSLYSWPNASIARLNNELTQYLNGFV